MQHSNFSPVLNTNCPNEGYNILTDIYKNAFNRAFPLQNFKIDKTHFKRSPWMTNGLLKSSISKSKLLILTTKRPTPNNVYKYKRFSSVYNKLLRKAKYTYHEQFSLAKNNINETWVLIKSVLNKNNVHDDLPDIFINNNMVLKNKKVIADSLNKYFATIGTQLSYSVPPSMHSFTHYLTRSNAHSLLF